MDRGPCINYQKGVQPCWSSTGNLEEDPRTHAFRLVAVTQRLASPWSSGLCSSARLPGDECWNVLTPACELQDSSAFIIGTWPLGWMQRTVIPSWVRNRKLMASRDYWILRFSSPFSNSNSMKINHLDPAHLSAQIRFTSTWQRPKGKLVQGHAELGDVEKGLQQRVHIAGRLGKKWRSSQRSLGKSPRESISSDYVGFKWI